MTLNSAPQPHPVDRVALSMREAADSLGLSYSTLKLLIATNELRVVRVGRRVLVPRSELDRLLRGE